MYECVLRYIVAVNYFEHEKLERILLTPIPKYNFLS